MFFVVPTPIGNLGDISQRAVDVLKDADLVLAEDTRNTGRLFERFEVSTPLQSFHAHNEHSRLRSVIDRLEAGENIALVTDAGMPGISDPGYLLIRECIKKDIEMDILPGPTAFVLGLLQSGFPNHIFQFGGFLPHKKGRKTAIESFCAYPHTTVLYESPYRVVKLLEQICSLQPGRYISVSRELTKVHQTTVRGTVAEVLERFRQGETIKGEFVVTIAPIDFSSF